MSEFNRHYIGKFLCRIRTCNDGCNVNKQTKVKLIFIHSITWISIAPINEYLNKYDRRFVYGALICNKLYKAFYYQLRQKGDTSKIRYFNLCFKILYIKRVIQLKMSIVLMYCFKHFKIFTYTSLYKQLWVGWYFFSE